MADESLVEADIPRGLGPGDIPDGIPWPQNLWIILPAEPSNSQKESLRRIKAKTQGEPLTVSEVKLQKARGLGGHEFSLIPAKDLASLYRRAHRARTAVIALAGAKVLLDISELPSNRGCITLEQFIRYKCSYSLVSRPEEVERALGEATAWMNEVHCEGVRDPRCLPRAVFETHDQSVLDTSEQRAKFIASHKALSRNRALADARGRTWQSGPNHTRDLIQVGGRSLPIGFHWDVQSSRDSVIATGWERWRLPGKGYTNVHPDALIRGGNATKTHPLLIEKEKAKSPRIPRQARRRRQ